ncbi:hypothetical protein [Methylibium sp.]|uniref:hypothetical protein n=1 Tax=Methylibium sp. TaxID=2067992 RepID=UPI0025DD4098|nr:hypothetical protein [Methylibium sp.]
MDTIISLSAPLFKVSPRDAYFPWLGAALDEERRMQLGTEVQAHLSSLLGEDRRDFDESEPAAALLEEAKLVLGSFPNAGMPSI